MSALRLCWPTIVGVIALVVSLVYLLATGREGSPWVLAAAILELALVQALCFHGHTVWAWYLLGAEVLVAVVLPLCC